MKYTTIIPCYNGSNYLKEALDCVLGQLCEESELIVINDASTDNTQEIIDSTKWINFKSIKRIANGGYCATRNDGVLEARGEFVSFLDHDDLWPKNRNEIIKDVISQHPDVGMIIGCMEHFFSPEIKHLIDRRYKLPSVMQSQFGSIIIRRNLLEKVGLFNTKLVQGEWLDLISRIRRLKPKIILVDDVLYLRRIHDMNFSHSNKSGIKSFLPSLREHIARNRDLS